MHASIVWCGGGGKSLSDLSSSKLQGCGVAPTVYASARELGAKISNRMYCKLVMARKLQTSYGTKIVPVRVSPAALPARTNMATPPPPPRLLDQPSCELPKVEGSKIYKPSVIPNTLSTLYGKLEAIRQAIDKCQNTRDLHQLFRALGECIQAIERTQSLVKDSPYKASIFDQFED